MTGEVRVRGLAKAFGDAPGLKGIDLDVSAGELVCVIGPSGSGKTTLLRCIAGLETPDAGSVEVDRRTVIGADARRASMVFQQDVLFPELSVAANVGFGLRAQGLRGQAVAEAVEVALLRLGLTGLEDRLPEELSGGQQRRVALARALVLRPTVLLLDEPLSGLDGALTEQGLRLIRTTHRRLGLTTVLVTHDQEAALAAADRLVVLDGGRVAQHGTPREVFERPDSLFVAQFVGRSAFLETEIQQTRDASGQRQALVRLLGADRWLPAHPRVTTGTTGSVLVRPHALRVRRTPEKLAPWAEPAGELAAVQDVEYRGDRFTYVVETEHGAALATGGLTDSLAPGDLIELSVTGSSVWVLPAG